MSDKKVRNNFLVQNARNQRRIAELENREGFIESLSELTPNAGFVNSGTQVYGDDITIDTTTSPATFTGSGYVTSWPPIEVYSGVYSVAFALENGAVTYYIRNTDGKLYAGAGAVTLDADGISVDIGTSDTNPNRYKLINSATGVLIGYLTGYRTGDDFIFSITADKTGEVGTAYLSLGASEQGGDYVALYLDSSLQDVRLSGNSGNSVTPSSTFSCMEMSFTPATPPAGSGGLGGFVKLFAKTNHTIHLLTSAGQDNTIHYGDYTVAFQNAVSTSAFAMVSRTIKANSLGATGWYHTWARATLLNNSGANRTYTITYNFGATSVVRTTAAIGAHATSQTVFEINAYTWNDAATNAQYHWLIYSQVATIAADTYTVDGGSVKAWKTGAVDTTADAATSLTITSSANNVTQTVRGIGGSFGPYYGA